jgi:hypothetical protein
MDRCGAAGIVGDPCGRLKYADPDIKGNGDPVQVRTAIG